MSIKFTREQVQNAVHQAKSRLSMKRLGETSFILSGPDAEDMNGKDFKTVHKLLLSKHVNIVCDELGIGSWPLKQQVYTTLKGGGVDLEAAFVSHLGHRIVEAM